MNWNLELIVSIFVATIIQLSSFQLFAIDKPPLRDEGRATWYGNGAHHGAIRADGKPFNPEQPLFAHRWIKLGTYILVESVETGATICAPVLDRGPYGALYSGKWLIKMRRSDPGKWKGVLDMSAGAAKLLHGTEDTSKIPNAEVRIYFRKNGLADKSNCYREPSELVRVIQKWLEALAVTGYSTTYYLLTLISKSSAPT